MYWVPLRNYVLPLVSVAAASKDGTAVAVLRRLFQELSAGQCTEEVARTLLKVMTENCQELEMRHRGQ